MPKPLTNGPTTWEPGTLTMPIGADALLSMTQPAIAAMAEFNAKLLDAAAKLNAEWADFLGRRLQEDLALPQRLVACKSPDAAQQVYAEYWKTTFAQYQEEMGRLAKMGESFTQQTTSAMQKHAEAITQEKQVAA
jgi:hypothetical protein